MTPNERRAELEWANREYHPCCNGLHVCGQIEDEHGERPLTLANFPTPTRASAETLLHAAKAELEDPDGEVCVDLNLGDGDHEDDFLMRRQMLPRLAALAAA